MIYKSNALVEAAYRLSVQEQRIVLACIAQVKRTDPVTDEVMYSVRAEDIATMAGVPIESSYGQLKVAALRLKRREIRFAYQQTGSNSKKSRTRITGWVQTVDYIDGEGRVELRFSKDMLPYLTELSREFTKYALADVAKMNSSHAIRLYELLRQWDTTGKRDIEIDQLREWLQLEERYPSIKDFKKWVLDPSIEQINEHSPIFVSWTQRKTGRKVTHLQFIFSRKESTAPVLDSDSTNPKKRTVLSKEQAESMALPGESYEELYQRLSSKYIIGD